MPRLAGMLLALTVVNVVIGHDAIRPPPLEPGVKSLHVVYMTHLDDPRSTK